MKHYHKLIGIDLSRQSSISIPRQINFTGKLEEDDEATIWKAVWKAANNILNFSLNSLIVTE